MHLFKSDVDQHIEQLEQEGVAFCGIAHARSASIGH